MVKTTEDKRKEEQEAKENGSTDKQKKGPKVEEQPPELSPEDQTLRDNIELMVEKINDPDAGSTICTERTVCTTTCAAVSVCCCHTLCTSAPCSCNMWV